MDLIAMTQSVSHTLAAFPLDDHTVSVLAMLAGIIGGWQLTSLHREMKARKAKVPRRNSSPRDPR